MACCGSVRHELISVCVLESADREPGPYVSDRWMAFIFPLHHPTYVHNVAAQAAWACREAFVVCPSEQLFKHCFLHKFLVGPQFLCGHHVVSSVNRGTLPG
eukprot:2661115-Amphidinium_carterae.1